MCSDYSSKVAIYEQDGIEALIRCLYSHDPDVQKNGIESLALLMQVGIIDHDFICILPYLLLCESLSTSR